LRVNCIHRSVAAKRYGFNRAILMMPSSSDQSSSTIDGRLTATSGTVRCGYRVTDTTAVSCYYPPPIANDKLYDTAAVAYQGQGEEGQRPLRCHHSCHNQHNRHDGNRKSSRRLLPSDDCTICGSAVLCDTAYRYTADGVVCDLGVIGSAVDLVAETGCAMIRNNQSSSVSELPYCHLCSAFNYKK